jgi:beta-fructofuranosidase
MALALPDRWVWDFWLARDGEDHHVFYLQAPKSLGDPELRHWNVSIGHAVSRDLRSWTVLPDALQPGPAGAWDDTSTWTGCTLSHGGRWYLFYTGTSSKDERLVQRVGLATSADLLTWTKHDGALLEADPRWYEQLSSGAWFDEAFRDPWVVPHGDGWRMLVTARAREGDPAGRGVVGLARSGDLLDWEPLPPLTAPLGFGQMEVPQLLERGGRWYLVFCSDVPTQSDDVRGRGLGTGTFYLVGDSPDGPFGYGGALVADAEGSTYAGRLHEDGSGRLVFLAWLRTGPDGGFVGELSDPWPVDVLPDGRLEVRR